MQQYPSADEAYEIALASSSQIDRSWSKLNDLFFRLIAMSAPLALPIPVMSRLAKIDTNHWGAWASLTCLVLIMVICFVGRCRGKKEALNPREIWSGFLHQEVQDFKVDMIHEMGKCFDANASTIARKWKFAYGAMVVLCLQTMTVAAWLILSPYADPYTQSERRETIVAERTSAPNEGRPTQRPTQPTQPTVERGSRESDHGRPQGDASDTPPPPPPPKKSATTSVDESIGSE